MSEKHGLEADGAPGAKRRKSWTQVRSVSGKSSAAYLRDNGWLGPDVLAAHWFFCDEADVEILAESGDAHGALPGTQRSDGPVSSAEDA